MSGTTTQNVVQTNLPSYAEGYYKQMMDWAGELWSPDVPYTTYDQPRIADFNNQQQSAFDMVGGLQAAYQGDFDAARQAAGEMGQYADQMGAYANRMNNISGLMVGAANQVGQVGNTLTGFGQDITGGGLYDARDYERQQFTNAQYQRAMNPYTTQVLDRARSRAGDAFADQQMLRDQQAARSGSFGGSRQAVADAMAQRDFNNQMLDLEATQLANAFNNAQGFLTGQRQLGETSRQFEANTRLRGADVTGMGANLLAQRGSMLGAAGNMTGAAGNLTGAAGGLAGQGGNLALNIGTNQGRADLSTVDALLKTGGLQQQLDQRSLDVGYQDFLRQQDWQRDMLGGYSSLLRGLPVSTNSTTTGTSTPGSPSTLNQIIGGATALYPLVSRLF